MGFRAELLEDTARKYTAVHFFKGGDEMQIRDEVFALTRAYEQLLASGFALTEDERRFLQYYFQEMAQHFDLVSDGSPTLLSHI